MLNRSKLLYELEHISTQLFPDTHNELKLVQQVWSTIANDPLLLHKIKNNKAPWLLPSWADTIGQRKSVTHKTDHYSVVAVDGSQIYPDRHQSAGCYLINVGLVQLNYGTAPQGITFESMPYLFALQDDDRFVDSSPDLVNCQREEFELRKAVEVGLKLQKQLGDTPHAILLDGSLIFWYLESKDEALKTLFIGIYLGLLEQAYRSKLPLASYISFPKSKELVNVVRMALCNFQPEGCTEHRLVNHLVDSHIAGLFLEQYERTTIFQHHSPITEYYPDHLKPYFFYLHVGYEIARVEIPAWVAHNEKQLDQITQIILDQTIKGRGYPVCLAESHEQAVVKGPDRDFFYHALQKVGIDHKQRYSISQKSLKKRGIGI